MLLIVTNKADLTSDFLILRMKERGVAFRRLNTEDYGKSFVVDICTSDMDMCYNVSFSNDVEMGKEDIDAVYFRQPLAPEVPNDIIPEDRGFHLRESKEILRSLWRLIDARKWINHPKNLWLASNKIEQLSLARRIGFNIPKTCVSTSRHVIEKFMKSCGMRVVCKAVKHGFLRETSGVRMAMTQRVGAEFLEYIGSYAPTPMIFQEEIRKSYDIRITIIGQTVFATAIHSQDYKETEVDWRHWDVSNVDLIHRPIKLPKNVEYMCTRMTKMLNLTYSAIDMVKDTVGNYYFLEMNPNGQWPWIERRAGYPVRDALIDHMLQIESG